MDLREFYGIDLVDTVRGTGVAPAVLVTYVRRLPDNSRFHALIRGGWEHHGWGEDRILAACQFNLTLAAAGGDKKYAWSIPKVKADAGAEQKPRTVKELFYGLPTNAHQIQ